MESAQGMSVQDRGFTPLSPALSTALNHACL